MIAHGFTVLVMRRSILTEKVSRRGYHLSREYATDPLEIIFVREAMRTNVIALPDTITKQDLDKILHGPLDATDHPSRERQAGHRQRLFPVLDDEQRLLGVVTRNDLVGLNGQNAQNGRSALLKLRHIQPVVAFPDEPLRTVVYRMAETGFTRLPVVERDDPQHLVGMISLSDLLKARSRNLEEERHRERILHLRLLLPRSSNAQVVNKKES